MKSQEVAVYREIQRNTEMAMKAIDAIAGKVYDDSLAMQISRQSLRYSQLHNEASKHLVEANAEPYHSNYVGDMMLKTSVNYNTLLNTSTGHIAEMMIKGSNNGIMEMQKVLNHNEEAGEGPKALAKELIEFENKSISHLKEYL